MLENDSPDDKKKNIWPNSMGFISLTAEVFIISG